MLEIIWILLGIVAVIAQIVVAWFIATYNALVSRYRDANTEWTNVESQYQKYADLIPNLVEMVKRYEKNEKIFETVTNARAHWDTAATPTERIAAAKYMDGSIKSMLALVVNNHHELKANQNFIDLHAQLDETEDSVSVAMNRYDEASIEYNIKTRFIVAKICGYKEKPLFDEERGKKMPKVNPRMLKPMAGG